MSVSRTSSPVNLPAPLDGLTYLPASFDGQSYLTTGMFAPKSPDRTASSLQAVGVLVLDFDLVDYLTHLEGWEGSSTARKNRMYTEYSDFGRLDDLKAKHLDDVKSVLEDVVEEIPGACVPTCIVDSGWGLHAYFWLDDIETSKEGISIAQRVNRELVAAVNQHAGYVLADPAVHDTGTRIMRTVGSANTQAMNKADIDFSLSCLVLTDESVASRWALIESARHVDANSYLPEFQGAASTPAGGVGATPPATVKTVGATRAGTLSSAASHALRRTWSWLGGSKGILKAHGVAEISQKSEADMVYACTLSAYGVPPDLTTQLIYDLRRHPNAHDGTDYYGRTAANAWTAVHGNTDCTPDANYNMMHPAVLAQFSAGTSPLAAIALIAQYDPRINEMLWVDERTKAIEWSISEAGIARIKAFYSHIGVAPPTDETRRRVFDDRVLTQIARWMESTYHVQATHHWREMATYISGAVNQRNPVRDYLKLCESVLPADADPELLETWLIRAFGLEDTPLVRVYSRKWLIGGAARGANPGVFLKSMLLLMGGQSAGKTSMLRILGGDYYDSPQASDLGSKDAVMSCNYSWLLEMEEMSCLGKSSTETVKKFITAEEDKMRLPYGSTVTNFPRACFYAGTSNAYDILGDSTGNDRFWSVRIPVGARCDFDFMRAHRDILWGLAYRAWKSLAGTQEAIYGINLTAAELDMAREANTAFERVDAATDPVLDAFWQVAATRRGAPALPLRATWEELLKAMLPADQRAGFTMMRHGGRQETGRVKDILTRAGFELKQRREGNSSPRFWLAPEAWNTEFSASPELTEDKVLQMTKTSIFKAIAARDHAQ